MFDDKTVVEIGKVSYSVSDLMIRLGLKPMGGNHKLYQQRCNRLGIIFLKRPHRHFGHQQRELGEYLVLDGPKIGTSQLRQKLYVAGLKQPKCEECGIENWQEKSLSFHLEHKDGNNRNNCITNLEILCPNCHSQTETYAKVKSFKPGKPKRKCSKCEKELYKINKTGLCKDCVSSNLKQSVKQYKTNCCKYCSKVLSKKRKLQCCRDCYNNHHHTKKIVDRPSLEEIKESVASVGYSATGRKYGVSDNCIRKWINNQNLV